MSKKVEWQTGSCLACGSADVMVTTISPGLIVFDGIQKLTVCKLCFSTHSANAFLDRSEETYPKGIKAILQAICFVGNEMLKAIEKDD